MIVRIKLAIAHTSGKPHGANLVLTFHSFFEHTADLVYVKMKPSEGVPLGKGDETVS